MKNLNTALYIAKEGNAFSKFPGLCIIQEKNGVNLGQNYRNRQACKGFIFGISDTFKNETTGHI